jgi:hypothetical protein
MSRPCGNKNKETVRREMAIRRAAHSLEQVDVVYGSLDALAVLQEVMGHFCYKARVLKSLGPDADFDAIDAAMAQAGKWAKEVAVFKHARIQAIRLAVDPTKPTLPENMTLEQLRDSIMDDFERLREAGILSLPALRRRMGMTPNRRGSSVMRIITAILSAIGAIGSRQQANEILGLLARQACHLVQDTDRRMDHAP